MSTFRTALLSLSVMFTATACQGDSGSDSGSGGKPSSAVETNVFRPECPDTGPCDGGAGTTDGLGETACDSDDDCSDGQVCGVKKVCAPRTIVKQWPTTP